MSTLAVNNITTQTGTTITVPTGKQLIGTDTGSFISLEQIVQIVTHRHGDLPNQNSSSFTEISANYRATITPQYNDSKILINATVNINPHCATNTIFLWKLMRSIGGASYADLSNVTDGNTGNRQAVSSGGGGRRLNGHDTNDQQPIAWHTY